MTETGKIYNGDCLTFLRGLPESCVQCCVTSPPYWGLRDYGVDGQLGLEKTPEEYVARMVEVFREVKRVLRDDGTLWLNLGDSYNGSGKGGDKEGHEGKQTTNKGTLDIRDRMTDAPGLKPKDLCGIPWMVAFALRSDGWYLRQDIIWAKPNPMPESVTDRCTKSHEYIFLLTKSATYFYDNDAVAEESVAPGSVHVSKKNGQKMNRMDGIVPQNDIVSGATRNKRSVWTVTTKPFKEAHFATFPPEIPRTCILAGTKKADIVLDPFMGAGTTAVVAEHLDRQWIGSELNAEYIKIAMKRIDRERAQMKLAL